MPREGALCYMCVQAVPHVAGVAALYLSDHRSASAQQVKDALLATASLRKIRGRMLPGTVNRLLHWPFPTAPTAAGAGCSAGARDVVRAMENA
jgi:subtilisin family serine protease